MLSKATTMRKGAAVPSLLLLLVAATTVARVARAVSCTSWEDKDTCDGKVDGSCKCGWQWGSRPHCVTTEDCEEGMMGVTSVVEEEQPAPGGISDSEEQVSLYFGSGCFWHIQYEVIEAEKKHLGREKRELTALVGYAGGDDPEMRGGKRVCYHGDPDDYDKYGHTEVVHVFVPRSKVPQFAVEFWKLFVGMDRVDVQDKGPEYRAALGLPGGIDSPLLAEFQAAQDGNVEQPFELKAGKGSDADTLGKPLVWVYDTKDFPFFQGEVYHQFHDDMVEKYDAPYHALKDDVLASGALQPTGCNGDGGEGVAQARIRNGELIVGTEQPVQTPALTTTAAPTEGAGGAANGETSQAKPSATPGGGTAMSSMLYGAGACVALLAVAVPLSMFLD